MLRFIRSAAPISRCFFFIITAYIYQYYYESVNPELVKSDITDIEIQSYQFDFVIIGGGSAGCVLANRLTENWGWKVLVLESGSFETAESKVPMLSEYNYETERDWNYKTVQQSGACLAQGGICDYHLGHVIGGGSSIGNMLYTRGSAYDFDLWSKTCYGWGWTACWSYFLQIENMLIVILRNTFHAISGYLNICYACYTSYMQEIYVAGGKELGFSLIDYNGESQYGISYPQFNLNGRCRQSVAQAYLNSVRTRKNLCVAYGARVTRIIIDEETKIAIGVEYIRKNVTWTVNITKEVICTAGAINTAKLLILSGIGPKDHLDSLGIKCLSDLPVGQNLQDHVHVHLPFTINKSYTITKKDFLSVESINEYAQYGNGSLSSAKYEMISFLHSNDDVTQHPDISHVFSSYYATETNEAVFSIICSAIRPQSTGNVTLPSSNHTDSPLICPNYFSYQEDYKKTIIAMQKAVAYIKTSSFQSYNVTHYTAAYPLCSYCYDDNNMTSYFCCVASNYSKPAYNPVGTTKMGPCNDPTAVVTTRLTVYGVKKIRICDSSIMPTIVSGSPQAATVMIAEKASTMIKQDFEFYGAIGWIIDKIYSIKCLANC